MRVTKGNPDELEREIGPRDGSTRVTSGENGNREAVQRYMLARGLPSKVVKGMKIGTLFNAYNSERYLQGVMRNVGTDGTEEAEAERAEDKVEDKTLDEAWRKTWREAQEAREAMEAKEAPQRDAERDAERDRLLEHMHKAHMHKAKAEPEAKGNKTMAQG